MSKRADPGRCLAVLVPVGCLLLAGLLIPLTSAAGFPTLPLGQDRTLFGNLTGAELSPGGSGTITFTVGDPLAGPMTATVVTIGVYAFNAFPGNATSTVPVASAPLLSNSTGSGATVNVTLGTVTAGRTVAGSVDVVSSATTPSGTFAVRTALQFTENGTAYLLESRGWFTAAAWTAATTGPNGSVVLNLTTLGVSGVIPETSILVSSSAGAWALWALLGVGIAVVAVGAYLYVRAPKSSSGVRQPPEETQAPRAFGTSRTSDGDRRSS